MTASANAQTQELVRYDTMCRAIAAAYEVDEVKDIRDKAKAIEVYARQSKNHDAETQACRIRLRAERRMGELLATMEKAKGTRGAGRPPKGGRTEQPPKDSRTLKQLGLTKDESARAQQLAAVPADEFEAALVGERPTASAIISQSKPRPVEKPMRDCVLWLWGRLRDFERDGVLAEDPAQMLTEMTEPMRRDVKRLAPIVAQWLGGVSHGE